jgi:hypothetical protein
MGPPSTPAHESLLSVSAGPGEKDAKLDQKLGQLQPFIAALPRECVGQLPSSGPAEHLARD